MGRLTGLLMRGLTDQCKGLVCKNAQFSTKGQKMCKETEKHSPLKGGKIPETIPKKKKKSPDLLDKDFKTNVEYLQRAKGKDGQRTKGHQENSM